MKRLKVLFITPWYPSKDSSVQGVFVREHAKAVRMYDDVVVFHCENPDPNLQTLWKIEKGTNQELTEGIQTYRLFHKLIPIPKISYLFYLICLFKAFRLILAKGYVPDIIHAHIYTAGFPAVIIGKLYRIPVVVTEQSSAIPRRLLKLTGVIRAKIAFKGARIVLPVSKALQKSIEAYGIRVKFSIVPNVADLKLFSPLLSRRRDNNKKRLLFVGLLVPVKGIKYMIRALSILQQYRDDWHLDIVGDGPEKEDYIELIDELNLSEQIKFHGIKAKSEIAEFMKRADIFVLTSTWDSLPCVLIEAMACGLPIVATAVGGIPEIVDEECGYLAESMNPIDISLKLDKALNNLSNFCPRKISNNAGLKFSYSKVGFQLHQIYLSNYEK